MSDLPKGFVGFVTASHSALFAEDDDSRCEVCGEIIEVKDDDDTSYDASGRGLLVWCRGDERRYQEPPLCASCATAIGVSALQRWETEEDEG